MVQKAIFVGIDGAQLEKLLLLGLQDRVPGFDRLDAIEAFTGGYVGAPSEQPTVSGPGWSTLLTGTWVDRHGVPENNDAPIAADVDSLFERVDAAIPDAKIASIVNWAPINTGHFARETGMLGEPGVVDIVQSGIPDAEVTDAVVDLIATEAPDFTFVHLDEPDGAGHGYGFGPEYDASLVAAAQQVGAILDAVEAREAANPDEDWMLVVSTDHGRDPVTGANHSAQTDSERRTFIAANEDLGTFDEPVPATSVAATVLDHLGIAWDEYSIESGSLLDGAGDPIPPTIVEFLTPADDAAFVPVDTDLVFGFSEAVEKGLGKIKIHDAATGAIVERIGVRDCAVEIDGAEVTIDLGADLADGAAYYVTIAAGAFTDGRNGFRGLTDPEAWSFATESLAPKTVLLEEDFESLAVGLGPFVSDSESGGDGTDWTATAPDGWSLETTAPAGGPAEFFGWTFLDAGAWVATSGDQRRSEFTLGEGVVAVADPDEYDDITPVDPDLYDGRLITPELDLAAIEAGTLRVDFDSSWLPEDTQTARLLVSFDGGPEAEVFRWSSDTADADYKPEATNEHVALAIATPDGAETARFAFDMPGAGNDWWWAVDNVAISGDTAASDLML